MASLFPDIPKAVEPAETQMNYFFDHLIACVGQGCVAGKLYYPNGIAIDLNNNQIYVAEGFYYYEGFPMNFARVSIFSETGEFLNTFSHPDMKKPHGIAIHGDNVYVTDTKDHCISLFKVKQDFRLAARLGSSGSGIGKFNDPRQLAVSTNGNVFVTDHGNNRVQILDSELRYQRHISHHSMKLPIDIELTPNEVFVLCQCSPCVKVFTYFGELLSSLITRGPNGMQVYDPSFFCLDTDRNLLLNFDHWRSHQIKIFSKGGTLLHTLGVKGGEVGMFDRPKGIAYTNNLRLVVLLGNLNYGLQIFSSD